MSKNTFSVHSTFIGNCKKRFHWKQPRFSGNWTLAKCHQGSHFNQIKAVFSPSYQMTNEFITIIRIFEKKWAINCNMFQLSIFWTIFHKINCRPKTFFFKKNLELFLYIHIEMCDCKQTPLQHNDEFLYLTDFQLKM